MIRALLVGPCTGFKARLSEILNLRVLGPVLSTQALEECVDCCLPQLCVIDGALLQDPVWVEALKELPELTDASMLVITASGDKSLDSQTLQAGSWLSSIPRIDENCSELELSLALLDGRDNSLQQAEGESRGSNSTRRDQRLGSHLCNAFIAVNKQGVITIFEGEAERIFGYRREEVLGKNLVLLLPESARHHHAELRQEFMRSTLPVRTMGERAEVAGRRANGSIFPASISIFAFDAGGETLAAAILCDMSPYRSLEKRLRQTHKLADMGRVAATVSHDFNNILTGIRLGADTFDDLDATTEDLREAIADIRGAIDRGSALSRQLLALSQPESDVPSVIQLGDAIGDLRGFVSRLVGSRIVTDFQIPSAYCPVSLNAGQLAQLLVNLAVNARDAMPEGGLLEVKVGCVELSSPMPKGVRLAPGRYSILSVRDNGTGMPEEVIDRIYEPYFTTKGDGKGTGLGLSSSRQMVRAAGGDISIVSEAGQGTLVSVYFQASDTCKVESEELPVTASRSTALPPMPVGIARLLLVDDDQVVCSNMGRILRRRGYNVIEAVGAGAALSCLEGTDTQVDLLIADLQMPVVSGLELWGLLRRVRPKLGALFISGSVPAGRSTEVPTEAGKEGLCFLKKPFSPEELIAAVDRATEGDEPGRDEPSRATGCGDEPSGADGCDCSGPGC